MTANLPEQTRFPFMSGHPRSRTSYRLTATLFLIGGLLTGGGLVIHALIRIIESEASRETYVGIFVGLLVVAWSLMSASATYLTSAEILLSGQQLIARVVGPWTVSLPLGEDSREMRSWQVQLPYRRLKHNEQLFTIPLTGLRPAARLAAMYMGIGFNPVLFITPDHEAYQTLVQVIQPDYIFDANPEELS